MRKEERKMKRKRERRLRAWRKIVSRVVKESPSSSTALAHNLVFAQVGFKRSCQHYKPINIRISSIVKQISYMILLTLEPEFSAPSIFVMH